MNPEPRIKAKKIRPYVFGYTNKETKKYVKVRAKSFKSISEYLNVLIERDREAHTRMRR